MTVTATSRFALNQWGAGTDPFTRAQRNADNLAVENNAALYGQNTLANRPASGKQGRFFWATDSAALHYDTGSAWTTTVPGAGTPASLTPGSVNTIGTGSALALATHVHALPAWSAGAPTASAVGLAGTAGASATFARGDHGHTMPASGATVDVFPGRSAAVGAASTLALSDHGHATYPWASSAVDLAFGAASAGGASNSYSRGDHTHRLPDSAGRGVLGTASVWNNINGGASGAEAGGVGVSGVPIVSGRRYRIIIKTGLLRSDSTADSSLLRVRIDDPATGSILQSDLVATPAGFAPGRYDPQLDFLGAASTNVAPSAGGLPAVAAGTRGFYLTFTKQSGGANAAFMILGATTQLTVEDAGT